MFMGYFEALLFPLSKMFFFNLKLVYSSSSEGPQEKMVGAPLFLPWHASHGRKKQTMLSSSVSRIIGIAPHDEKA